MTVVEALYFGWVSEASWASNYHSLCSHCLKSTWDGGLPGLFLVCRALRVCCPFLACRAFLVCCTFWFVVMLRRALLATREGLSLKGVPWVLFCTLQLANQSWAPNLLASLSLSVDADSPLLPCSAIFFSAFSLPPILPSSNDEHVQAPLPASIQDYSQAHSSTHQRPPLRGQ